MGGVTPLISLPYPTGTDRVADGDNAIRALAENLAGYLGGGVVSPVPAHQAGITPALAATWSGSVTAWRRGGVVFMELILACTGQPVIGQNILAAPLPAGYWPLASARRVVQDPAGNTFGAINVLGSTGFLTVQYNPVIYGGVHNLHGGFSYIAGA